MGGIQMDGVGFWAMEDIRKEDEAMAAALAGM
jgi:hypothetical protein